jgi:hypothetical protein
VRLIWHTIHAEAKVIFLGCGSAGKSYSSAAWFLLDYLRDPAFTNTKIISSTAGHAKSNIFSTFANLHAKSRIKLPGIRIDGFIGLDSANRHAGISRVSIPAGESGRAALQGFHPIPRSAPDPIFGTVGRVRALVDEAEEVPLGLWRGVQNMLLSMEGTDLIKVVAATNPHNVLSPLASYAMPVQGWNRIKADIDKKWVSKEGWLVQRIDGVDLENVRERRVIYSGFMTFSGFENLRLKGGGNSPDYWTLARGMYSLEGVNNALIPLSYLDTLVGTLLFVGRVVPCGSLDVAFESPGDECVLCAGRYGLASGWRDQTGAVRYFEKSRYCLQIDQFFTLAKVRTIQQAENVIDYCKRLAISPEWFVVDKTAIGTGLHDSLMTLWDPEVVGINWGEGPTEKKILEDDSTTPIEEYENLATEMHWALRKYIEFEFIKTSPTLDTDKLFREMTLRTYQLGGKGPTDLARTRIQPKKEFKALHGWSPDRADALVMLLHRVRILGPERARMFGRTLPRRQAKVVGVIERGAQSGVKWNPSLDS